MPKWVPLAVALALSLAVNLYLLLGRDTPASTATPPPSDRLVERESASAVKLKPAEEAPRKPAPTPTVPDAGPTAANCDAQLSLARAQVAVLRTELDHHLTLAERFERGGLDATTDRRLRPHLERLLTADAGISSWSLECRNQICKLHFARTDFSMQWGKLSQRDREVQRMVRSSQAIDGIPTQNQATGETVTENDTWLEIADEEK
jgi:hypothetical protein